jgi:phosphoesterase RecJ-like protein
MKGSSAIDNLGKVTAMAKHVIIIQPENPDGDSLSTALALEKIFFDLKLDTTLYCAVQIPRYLRHIPGWDRVTNNTLTKPDFCLILDTNKASLLDRTLGGILPFMGKIPTFVIDHHAEEADLPFKFEAIEDNVAATGELVYTIASRLTWPLSPEAGELLLSSILYDTLGLTTPTVSSQTVRTVADLMDRGASIAKLEEARKEMLRRDKDITNYKGQLLQRIEYLSDNRIAYLLIPWEEIQQYSERYNPSMLVLEEMRLTNEVLVAVAFKSYPDGKLTAKIRTTHEAPIADQIAHHFGGGGHSFAAGFKVYGQPFQEVLDEFGVVSQDLLSKGKV